LPWIVGALAFITLIVIFAAQRAGQAPVTAAAPPTGGAGAVDIASMTPQERASRLFDRARAGKAATVIAQRVLKDVVVSIAHGRRPLARDAALMEEAKQAAAGERALQRARDRGRDGLAHGDAREVGEDEAEKVRR
jgi:hypothetical protein